ncbi:MAG: hypothetical protein P4N59_17695 [Negativicutes bacterium]|nr:hypothetical protein [Negativicutes bacterium]
MERKAGDTPGGRRSGKAAGQADLRPRFVRSAAAALKTMLELMTTSTADAVRLRAAQDILDRAGFKVPERREGSGAAGGASPLIDYSDPAAVAARIDELRRRLEGQGRSVKAGEAQGPVN